MTNDGEDNCFVWRMVKVLIHRLYVGVQFSKTVISPLTCHGIFVKTEIIYKCKDLFLNPQLSSDDLYLYYCGSNKLWLLWHCDTF